MKILVFSDSHGNSRLLSAALKNNIAGLDLCVFLGDGTDDIESALVPYPSLPRIIVSGNCEEHLSPFLSGVSYPTEETFEAQGVRFLALHGHRPVNVKNGLGAAASYAASQNADILLYGHTHVKDDRTIELTDKSVRLINPGSVGRGSNPSYALLTLIDGVLLCGFGENIF